ncbi:MAG: hypothetical protein FE834_00975 [Gammaproteobacteria bacterium]|nr:hypothetical protein [Gammaproteobacteria bacterium]
MKNIKTLLLATLASFMMATSTLANPISNDADLIFINNTTQSMDFAQLSNTEMQATKGASFWEWVIAAATPEITITQAILNHKKKTPVNQ